MEILPHSFLNLNQIYKDATFCRQAEWTVLKWMFCWGTIWCTYTNWICNDFLQWPKAGGGLVLPNFRGYYWSANVQKMSYWIQSPVQTGVGRKACHAYHSSSMPWLHLIFRLRFHSSHPTQLSSPLSKYGLNLGDIIIWRKLFLFRAHCVTITTSKLDQIFAM